jgi:hypothetical protein
MSTDDAMGRLKSVLGAIEDIGVPALSFSMVMGDDPEMEADELDAINLRAESLLKECETIQPYLPSDPTAVGFLNFARGRLYAIYLPRKAFPILRYVSHKKEAIDCYSRAATGIKIPGMLAQVHYNWGMLHFVWDDDGAAREQFRMAIDAVGADTPEGQQLAETVDELLA